MNLNGSYDLAVLIGRFQPFHRGHAALLEKALESAPRVAVVLGSSLRGRNVRNPFTWRERADMMAQTLAPEQRVRLHFIPIRDYYDDRRWAAAVTRGVEEAFPDASRILLICHTQDPSSFHLDCFPTWDAVAAGLQGDYRATPVRGLLFGEEDEALLKSRLAEWVPAAVQSFVLAWMASPPFLEMREEFQALEASRKIWGRGPFVTLDALVSTRDHVLLVRRGRCPGKGQWAIPGGFLDADERLCDGALRELREETLLDLKDPSSRGRLKMSAVFDHPERSQRGRTITHAYHFELCSPELPNVAGADDAAEARWIPIADLVGMEDQFFDDHFHILDHFLKILPS